MAITQVGTAQIGTNVNGADVTLTFDGTPAQNDIVVLFGGHGQDDAVEPYGPSTSGYNPIWTSDGDAGAERATGAWYKILGASPDATVVCQGGGDANDGVGYACVVLRGVDTATPMDATRTVAGPTASTNPANAPIDTVTNGAWVVLGALSGSGDAAFNAPSGWSTGSVTGRGNDNNVVSLGLAFLEIVSAGTVTPGTWQNWTTGTWKAVTIAVRPAGAGIDVDVLPATEAETANPIDPLISREVAVGTATEVELGQTIDPQINRDVAVGTATEVETANPIAPVWSISLGTATEVELANPIDPLISREVAVGTATEVELGQPITSLRAVSVDTAVEVELGQPITPAISREVAVGVATERELALEITPEIAGPPTCGVDVVGWQMADGRPFAWTSWGTFGPGFVHVQECTVGPINLPIGLAVERELAQPITPTIPREVAVGTAVERELANTIDPQIDREVAVGTATERELAQSITPTIGRAVLVNTATERELANGITPAISREVVIGVATEVELARFISPVKPIFVPVQTAVERELARVMTPFQGTPFIPKVVCDILTLPVACEVSSVPVTCDVFSVGVDCEMVDVYGQGH